jgi:hypothetical protein
VGVLVVELVVEVNELADIGPTSEVVTDELIDTGEDIDVTKLDGVIAGRSWKTPIGVKTTPGDTEEKVALVPTR